MMNKDKSEEKRLELTQKIIKVEQKEDDFVDLTKKHEDRVADLGAAFNQLSHEIENLLYDSPQLDSHTIQAIQDNQELAQRMNRYIDEHLADLEENSRRIRWKLDDQREDLITERNRLPWE